MNEQEKKHITLEKEQTLLVIEATFSAWLRTALAAMAGGLAVLRLIHFKSDFHRIIAMVIGEILILWACAIVIISAIDYKRTRKRVGLERYKGSTVSFLIMIIPLFFISILLVWVTLP